MMEIYDLSVRAWDKTLSAMFYGVNLYSFGSSDRITHAQIRGRQEIEKVGVRVDLMLWTGLYDTNGKKIYKSDIVDFCFAKGRKTLRSIVTFEGGKFLLTHPNGQLQYGVGDVITKVVGNIYEHPHLMKEDA